LDLQGALQRSTNAGDYDLLQSVGALCRGKSWRGDVAGAGRRGWLGGLRHQARAVRGKRAAGGGNSYGAPAIRLSGSTTRVRFRRMIRGMAGLDTLRVQRAAQTEGDRAERKTRKADLRCAPGCSLQRIA